MIGRIKKKIAETSYAMKFRETIQQQTDELVRITYKEVKKELERRKIKL